MTRKEQSVKRVILAEGFALPVEEKHFDQIINTASKPVLVDFWASWCGPCRRENPNLVNTYNKYKNKKFKNGNGLEIYSVSLDKKFSSWVKALTNDKLFWQYHVSDLKGWQSDGAAIYDIRSIPQTFIIDGDGVIIAKNLKAENLNKFLDSKRIN